jgi:hypothetical protein
MSDSEISETWTSRDLPVLRAVVALEAERGLPFFHPDVVKASGLGESEVLAALGALDRGYLEVVDLPGGVTYKQVTAVLERARRAVGSWPSETEDEVTQRLLAVLEELVQQAPEGSPERTKWERLRAAAGDVSGQVLAGVIVMAAGAGLG